MDLFKEHRLDNILSKVETPDLTLGNKNPKYQNHPDNWFDLSPLSKNKESFNKIKESPEYYSLYSRSLNLYYKIPRGINFVDDDIKRLDKTAKYLTSQGHGITEIKRHRGNRSVRGHIDGSKSFITESTETIMNSLIENIINNDKLKFKSKLNNILSNKIEENISILRQKISKNILKEKSTSHYEDDNSTLAPKHDEPEARDHIKSNHYAISSDSDEKRVTKNINQAHFTKDAMEIDGHKNVKIKYCNGVK